MPPVYNQEVVDPKASRKYWINHLREKTNTELGKDCDYQEKNIDLLDVNEMPYQLS